MEKEKKMYWKNGFYDCPVEGSVEITVEYWKALLDGQASGKEIKENVDGYPVLVEHEFTLDELKGMKIAEINAYDKSDSVNSFTLTGKRYGLTRRPVSGWSTQSVSRKKPEEHRPCFGIMRRSM